jgi:hypothetical protein
VFCLKVLLKLKGFDLSEFLTPFACCLFSHISFNMAEEAAGKWNLKLHLKANTFSFKKPS